MKIPRLPRLSSLAPQPKARKAPTRLAAHARRLTPPAYEDYDEEPTTKLSTAFVVVLALHLVAVGGIWAFHGIKAKRREADGTAAMVAPAKEQAPATVAVSTMPAPAAPAPRPAAAPLANVQPPQGVTQAASSPSKAPVAAVSNDKGTPHASTPAAQPAATAVPKVVPVAQVVASNSTAGKSPVAVPQAAAQTPAAEVSAKVYTVQRGDNPVAIAKKCGVNYEELLKLNGVEDPKKLQIGQVLKLPPKKSIEPVAH